MKEKGSDSGKKPTVKKSKVTNEQTRRGPDILQKAKIKGRARKQLISDVLKGKTKQELIDILQSIDDALVKEDLGNIILNRTAPPCQRISHE